MRVEKVDSFKKNKESVNNYIIESKLHKLIIKELSGFQSKEILSSYLPDYTSSLSVKEIRKVHDMIKEHGITYMLNNFKYHKNETLIKIMRQ